MCGIPEVIKLFMFMVSPQNLCVLFKQKGEKGDLGRAGITGMPGLPGTPVSIQ